MELTVLGNNGPFPGAGSACSGYLLEDGETRLLIDCGNGVLANLQKIIPIEKIDAIILTHLHSDHISDMMVLKYAIQIKTSRKQMARLLRVYAPNQPEEEYRRLDVKDTFELNPISEELNLQFGSMEITFKEMKHPYKTFAVSAKSRGRRFVFSGDTAWTQAIVDFSNKADLVMLDAGLLSIDKTGDNVPHMTAAECGEAAFAAGAKRLLLTHFWPEYDKDELLAEAKAKFPSAQTAELMQSYKV